MIVLDASAAGSFLIPDEAGPFAEFARAMCNKEPVLVPSHWHVEIGNLIRKATWRGRISKPQAVSLAAVADAIAATVTVAAPPVVERLVVEGNALGLSAYDTGYFLLARSHRFPLLTDDGKLRRVAREQGLTVLMP